MVAGPCAFVLGILGIWKPLRCSTHTKAGRRQLATGMAAGEKTPLTRDVELGGASKAVVRTRLRIDNACCEAEATLAKTARKGVVLFFSLVVIEGKAIQGAQIRGALVFLAGTAVFVEAKRRRKARSSRPRIYQQVSTEGLV